MNWLSLLTDQRTWCLIGGLFIGLAWHNYQMRGVELELAAERERKQQVVIEYRERESAANTENTTEYLEALDNARKESDALRRDLADGRIKLRVCLADSVRAAVAAGNSAAAIEQARADQRRLEEDAVRLIEKAQTQEAWIESAHEWINRE